MTSIFIDGSAGTAGLRIHERLKGRDDLLVNVLPPERRKDPEARRDALNSCDIAILCLPDQASVESVGLIESPHVRVIDTSTAHRVAPGWAYGFPELSAEFRKKIADGSRVASTGCHAGGFVSLVYPLVEAGLLPQDALLSCHSVTGYSGGGKAMIAEYEGERRNILLNSPRQYALTQQHKHLREMKAVCGLDYEPIFCPIVADYYCGMCVTLPLHKKQLFPGAGMEDVKAALRAKYCGPVVRYTESLDIDGFVAANQASESDLMRLAVCGNEERMTLISLFDNLGKGASGCAVQCLNIMLGLDETLGLVL